MPKMKTHSGAKKRFKMTGKGKKLRAACLKDPQPPEEEPKRKRQMDNPLAVAEQDLPRVRSCSANEGQAFSPRPQEAARSLERTKGFRGEANHNYKRAKEALIKAETYAYRDRRNRKRDFRRLWITRINAAAKPTA